MREQTTYKYKNRNTIARHKRRLTALYLIVFLFCFILGMNLMHADDKCIQTTEVVKTIRHPFSTANWNNMSEELRQQAIQAFINNLSAELGIKAPLITWEPQQNTVGARYSPSMDAIILNTDFNFDPETLGNTLIHEMRHAYQYAHINDDTDQARAWKENNEHYISGDIDLAAHMAQPLEADAWGYVSEYHSKYGSFDNITVPVSYTVTKKISQKQTAESARRKKSVVIPGYIMSEETLGQKERILETRTEELYKNKQKEHRRYLVLTELNEKEQALIASITSIQMPVALQTAQIQGAEKPDKHLKSVTRYAGAIIVIVLTSIMANLFVIPNLHVQTLIVYQDGTELTVKKTFWR